MIIISSKSNNLIKKTKKLLQKKHRQTSYLIEGWHLFEEAVANQAKIEQIFIVEEQWERLGDEFSQVTLVTPEVLKELSQSPTPQGIVCQVALENSTLLDRLDGAYLLLEDIQDPGNVGTMIRTADAAGLSGVLITDKTADIYSPKTLRSMQGSHFHLPIYRAPIQDLLDLIRGSKIRLIATTLAEDSVDYQALSPEANFVLAMGNEGQGITENLAVQADVLAHIPMPGQAESLNVAVATGIMLFWLIERSNKIRRE